MELVNTSEKLKLTAQNHSPGLIFSLFSRRAYEKSRSQENTKKGSTANRSARRFDRHCSATRQVN